MKALAVYFRSIYYLEKHVCQVHYLPSNIYHNDAVATVYFHFVLRQPYPLSKASISSLEQRVSPLRVALYRCQDAGLLIGVGRRQDHVALGIGAIDAIDASLVAGFNQSYGVVDDTLLEVGPHVATLREPAAAVGAGVRLGAGMIVEVGLEMVLLGEGLRAQVALVRLQAGVQPGVEGHVGAIGERLLADLALIRPFAGMGPQMLLEQHLPRERLAALLALMRLHAGVYAHVHVVGHALVEALAAFRASVLLAIPMDLHVRAQVTAIVEVLAAFRTGRRELPRALVHAAVILVVAQLRELFAAIGAAERLLAGVRSAVHLR